MPQDQSKSQPLERLTIWPHRSLSRNGFAVLITMLAILLSTIGVGFFLAGAWPVIGFLGLELLVVWGAFNLNYRAAKVRETIEANTETLQIACTDERGKSSITQFPVGWLRVYLSPSVTPDVSSRYRQRVVLSSHGRTVEVGAFLHPAEKAKLHREVDGMVSRSRAARDKISQN